MRARLWDPAEVPIEPLGRRGLVFFYHRFADDTVLALHARDHTPAGLLGLTGGETAFYLDGWEMDGGAIDWEAAAAYLMRCCHARGEYRGTAAGTAGA